LLLHLTLLLISPSNASTEDKPTASSANFDPSAAKGSIPLVSAQINLLDSSAYDREFSFGLTPAGGKRMYVITTDSRESLHEWISAILDCGATYSPTSKTLLEHSNVEKVSVFSTKEGFLWKHGEFTVLKVYKRRYFVLEQGSLIYYRGNDPTSLAEPLRVVDLRGASVSLMPLAECANVHALMPSGSVSVNCQNVINLTTAGEYLRTFTLVAQDEAIALEWISAIQAMIMQLNSESGTGKIYPSPDRVPRNSISRFMGLFTGGDSSSTEIKNYERKPAEAETGRPKTDMGSKDTSGAAQPKKIKSAKEMSPESLALYMHLCSRAATGKNIPTDDPNFPTLTSELAAIGIPPPRRLSLLLRGG